jgi:hypothetical protein
MLILKILFLKAIELFNYAYTLKKKNNSTLINPVRSMNHVKKLKYLNTMVIIIFLWKKWK